MVDARLFGAARHTQVDARGGDLLSFPHFTAVRADDWPWPHFTAQEMACQGTGVVVVGAGFMRRLEAVRRTLGEPMRVTSGYRTPEHNRRVSRTGYEGPHTTGRAVDVAAFGERALRLVRIALAHGFTGIGLKQKGPHHLRFVHLDDLAGDHRTPRPWIWTY